MGSIGIPTLRRLANIINEAVDKMETAYTGAEQPLPSLDVPFNPNDPAEAVLQDPIVAGAVLNIMAAASQLSATVCSPASSALNASQAFHISSCLRVASELNVVELLREAGSEGLHATKIAAPSKIDPALLARILRLLATHNIFREVTPNVFANNRISSAIDKGKPSSVLFEKREERLAGTSGLTALVEFFSEDIFKSAAYLTDTLLDQKEGVLPYHRGLGTDQPLYYWMQRPENLLRLQRFGLGMQGTAATESPDAIFTGFDWSALPPGSILVDVGGGLGHTSMTIAQRNPALRIINQDLEHQVDGAKLHWKENFPSHVESQMVEFQAHDFFQPQPVKDVSVFLLRYILHNWPDVRAAELLRRLREAAQPTTQLVVIEKILSVAATVPSSDEEAIPGAARPLAPAPLLPNWGVGKAEFYFYDMAVHNMLGGGERTLGGFIDVLAQGGWKLTRVHHCVGSQLSHIVAVPA
ncbi:O-methyltransferase [Mycena galopus ATCC 62051]|nr:O-methyltransferase [Mycena galopus ATCC 62051]